MEDNNPLVSIIVRTKDRPELLERALQSIGAQTYRPIEVVLVNDGGCGLDTALLRNILDDVSLEYVQMQSNLGRAHAGNMGIEHSHGEYIGFLDDDDEFYPEHVETLVAYIEQNNCEIAYTSVECVEKEYDSKTNTYSSELLKFHYAKDFSYNDLLAGNYIPLISLLFRSDILKTVLFDESFDLYEDWDMLLRAAENYRFYFINKVTAKYIQWGDSQIAFQSSPEIMEQTISRMYAKHWTHIRADLLARISQDNVRKDDALAGKDSYIRKLEGMITEKDSRISQLESRLTTQETALSTIHKSRGWKALSAYYKLRDKLVR
ncbi:MAG: glycosyltransferase [Nitrospiraceae bacterium]|nr:MAG: glycosyltransferase [Nitrospiraceae bacterium]